MKKELTSFLLQCAARFNWMWNGGNQWSVGAAYLSFFRDVVKLDIDWTTWAPYQYLAEHSGPRVVHEDFVIIADRPSILKLDAQGRPHCTDGPFAQWRDGWSLYAIHGVTVPSWVVLEPEKITVETIKDEANAEVKRVMLERYPGGIGAYFDAVGAKVLDSCDEDHPLVGLRTARLLEYRDDGVVMRVVDVLNSTPEPDGTTKRYTLQVHPELRPLRIVNGQMQLGEPQKPTVQAAIASTFGMRAEEYQPLMET